jgi:hypothetical protein
LIFIVCYSSSSSGGVGGGGSGGGGVCSGGGVGGRGSKEKTEGTSGRILRCTLFQILSNKRDMIVEATLRKEVRISLKKSIL